MAKFKKGDKVVLKEGSRALSHRYESFNTCDTYYTVDENGSTEPFLLDTAGNRGYARQDALELYEPETTLGTGLKESTDKAQKQVDWYTQIMMDYISQTISNINNNKTNMTSIKTRIKTLALTQPKKALVQANLMDIDGEWSMAAKDYAREMMLAGYMKTDDFMNTMKEVADDINKEQD